MRFADRMRTDSISPAINAVATMLSLYPTVPSQWNLYWLHDISLFIRFVKILIDCEIDFWRRLSATGTYNSPHPDVSTVSAISI